MAQVKVVLNGLHVYHHTASLTAGTGQQEALSVGTVHLESLDNEEMRIAQLQEIFRILNHSKHVLFTGDFNFTPAQRYL
jgi:endonuclease/exonuclease/phosphatase family metal-dependent hydrolase